MPKFTVKLTSTVTDTMRAFVTVEAEDETAATDAAINRAYEGGVEWESVADGVPESVTADEVTPAPSEA